MSHVKEIIKNHSMKHCRKIQAICDPLLKCLDIPTFSYYRIEPNGRFVALTNQVELLNYYYSEEMYLQNPYLTDPKNFRSGYMVAPIAFNPEAIKTIHSQFKTYYFFIFLARQNQNIEAFLFANQDPDISKTQSLLSNVDLFHKFASYFKQKASSLIAGVEKDHFNLKEEKKEGFFASSPFPNQSPERKEFLKKIAPLSLQETRCLDLFKQGHSAQSTAALLNLSPRTVEFYFENIKAKLDCSSKWDLLQW